MKGKRAFESCQYYLGSTKRWNPGAHLDKEDLEVTAAFGYVSSSEVRDEGHRPDE